MKYLTALLALSLLAGCAWMDLDGDGEVNPRAYLANSDITVSWVGEDGAVYNVAVDEFGRQIVGQFIQAKTGYLFEVTDEGGLVITDPSGMKYHITPR